MGKPKRKTIRFIDLCAGLGGFHHGASLAQDELEDVEFKCVLAAELDDELRELYVENFPDLTKAYKAERKRSPKDPRGLDAQRADDELRSLNRCQRRTLSERLSQRP